MEKELTTLSVMNQMVVDNSTGIMLSTTIVDNYKTKQGGVICFGVTSDINSDVTVQRTLGLPSKYMLMCFAVNREELEFTKQKLISVFEKRFYIRESYNTAFKNKLDEKLREAFKPLVGTICTLSDLDKFKAMHKKVHDEYTGRCQPIEYRDSSMHFTPTSSRTNYVVYVTDGYWLDLMPIKE